MLGASEIENLLGALCVDLGFCLPAMEQDRLIENPPDDATEFANAIFLAEGLNPETADRHLFRQVRERIVAAMTQAAANR